MEFEQIYTEKYSSLKTAHKEKSRKSLGKQFHSEDQEISVFSFVGRILFRGIFSSKALFTFFFAIQRAILFFHVWHPFFSLWAQFPTRSRLNGVMLLSNSQCEYSSIQSIHWILLTFSSPIEKTSSPQCESHNSLTLHHNSSQTQERFKKLFDKKVKEDTIILVTVSLPKKFDVSIWTNKPRMKIIFASLYAEVKTNESDDWSPKLYLPSLPK